MPHRSSASAATVAALAFFLAIFSTPAGAAGANESALRLGSPTAEISEDPYDGPAVVGDSVTLVPELAPLAPGRRSHQVRLDVVAREIEVAPGVRFLAWTFGGTVPGPVVHVRQGDRIEFTMTNRTHQEVALTAPARGAAPFLLQVAERDPQNGTPAVMPMPHSIDFHAATVAPSDKYRSILPGQTIRFEWTANYPGVFVYHCGQPPVFQHMAMGQYGVVVVEPRDGYPTDAEIDRSYVIVQSEFYLAADESGAWTLDFPAALAKLPSQVVFNGHTRALIDAPLRAEPGERVRLYVHNVGPTDTSSFHVIGTVFDRVWYEGNPANEMRGMQTVLLGASNGAVVEFIVPEEGEYPFVDHEFADASRGAVGKLRTGGAAPGAGMQSH